MSNEFKLYLLTRLDSIESLGTLLIWLSILMIIVYYIGLIVQYGGQESERYESKYKYIRKIGIWTFSIVAVIFLVLPSRNEAILIYAGGKTMDFIQADTSINKIPAKSTEFIIKYLDEKVKELDKEDK